MQNIARKGPFNFFPAIIKIVRELVISNMHKKFGKDTVHENLFMLSCPQGYWSKMRKNLN